MYVRITLLTAPHLQKILIHCRIMSWYVSPSFEVRILALVEHSLIWFDSLGKHSYHSYHRILQFQVTCWWWSWEDSSRRTSRTTHSSKSRSCRFCQLHCLIHWEYSQINAWLSGIQLCLTLFIHGGIFLLVHASFDRKLIILFQDSILDATAKDPIPFETCFIKSESFGYLPGEDA